MTDAGWGNRTDSQGVVPDKPTSELAADVRGGIWSSEPNKADAALDALVARVADLEAQVAALTQDYNKMVVAESKQNTRAEAAEAELVKRPTLEEAVANVNYWKDKAEAAEAALAQANATLHRLAKNTEAIERQLNASEVQEARTNRLLVDAEAALATTRQALAEIRQALPFIQYRMGDATDHEWYARIHALAAADNTTDNWAELERRLDGTA